MKGGSGVGSEDVGTVWNCLQQFCEVIHWPSVSTRLSSFLTDVESSRVSVGATGQFLMCLLLSLHPSSYSFLASASPTLHFLSSAAYLFLPPFSSSTTLANGRPHWHGICMYNDPMTNYGFKISFPKVRVFKDRIHENNIHERVRKNVDICRV